MRRLDRASDPDRNAGLGVANGTGAFALPPRERSA